MAQDGDKVPELLDAIAVVNDAIAMASAALHDNPTKEEERALNRALIRLHAELAILEAELDAALAGSTSVHGPSEAQLEKIAALIDKVELLQNASASVGARLAFAARVLTVAASAFPSKPTPAPG